MRNHDDESSLREYPAVPKKQARHDQNREAIFFFARLDEVTACFDQGAASPNAARHFVKIGMCSPEGHTLQS